MADLRLGGQVDPATHQRTEAPATVRAEDLTTHGVIVGVTGSGKSGLGIVLVEECLRAGVPALLIDPKGDLTNLALTFPDLAPAQFEPWVSASTAAKAGQDGGVRRRGGPTLVRGPGRLGARRPRRARPARRRRRGDLHPPAPRTGST